MVKLASCRRDHFQWVVPIFANSSFFDPGKLDGPFCGLGHQDPSHTKADQMKFGVQFFIKHKTQTFLGQRTENKNGPILLKYGAKCCDYNAELYKRPKLNTRL